MPGYHQRQLLGDDLFATDLTRLDRGITGKIANAPWVAEHAGPLLPDDRTGRVDTDGSGRPHPSPEGKDTPKCKACHGLIGNRHLLFHR
ncbi:hypothetical protein YIM_22350 [Amycolatopsis sp. YIM 10]|nr:hypothetical protein YIM_22350 [Amycolatopsis sp. YIM 10]